MAFTYNSAAKVIGLSSADPVQFNFTAGTNSKLVVLTLCYTGAGATGSSGTPTYNGLDMSPCGSTQSSQEGATEIWYYLSPDAGTPRQISIPNSATTGVRYVCTDYLNSGADASFFAAGGASDQSGADVPASIASVPDASVCVSCMVHGEKDVFASISVGTTLMENPPATPVPSFDEGSMQTGAAYSLQSGTGTETHTYVSGGTSDDFNWVMGAWEETSAPVIEPVAGQSDVVISTTGDLSVTHNIAGQVDAAISTTGVVEMERNIAGQSDIGISVSGTMGKIVLVAGQVDVSVTTTGDLATGVQEQLDGQSDLSISVTGVLSVTRTIVGTVTVAISTSGTVDYRPTGGTPHALMKPIRGIQLNKSHWAARNLLGCWIMNEATGMLVNDVSGQRHHGLIEEETTFSSSQWTIGKHGAAYQSDYVATNVRFINCGGGAADSWADFSSNHPFSISAVVKQDTLITDGQIISKGYVAPQTAWQLKSSSAAGNVIFGAYNSTNFGVYSGDGFLQAGVWLHIVATYNGTTWTLYGDGKLRNSAIANSPRQTARLVVIGAINSAVGDCIQPWGGEIDHVMLWDRALKAGEVLSLYHHPFQMFEDAEFDSVGLLVPTEEGAEVSLSGQVNVAVSTTASLDVDKKLSGQSDVTVSVSGGLSVVASISGQSDVSITVSGTLEAAVPLAGQSDISVACSGVLEVSKELAGEIDVTLSSTGALSTAKELSGASDITVTCAGTLSAAVPLAGQSDASVSVTGTLSVTTGLAGQSDVAISTSGALSVEYSLAGQSDIVISTTGDLSVQGEIALQGQTDAAVSTSGALSVAKTLTGQSDITVSVTGVLSKTQSLAGQSDISVSVTGTLEAVMSIQGAIDSAITVSGALSVVRGIAGQSDVVISTTADLTVTGEITLQGQSDVVIVVSGGLSVVRNLVGQSDVVILTTAELTVGQIEALVGQVNVAVTSAGAVNCQRSLIAASEITVTAAGGIQITIALNGATDLDITVTGAIIRTRGLTTTCDVVTSLIGGMVVEWALAGQTDVVISTTARLTGQAKPGWSVGSNVGALNATLSRI